MEKIEQLFEDYRIALLEWNDACKNARKDIGKIKLVGKTYGIKEDALNDLQDEIIRASGDTRHFKRNGEI